MPRNTTQLKRRLMDGRLTDKCLMKVVLHADKVALLKPTPINADDSPPRTVPPYVCLASYCTSDASHTFTTAVQAAVVSYTWLVRYAWVLA